MNMAGMFEPLRRYAVYSFGFIAAVISCSSAVRAADVETYVREEMPPGFGVTVDELEGPVFVNEKGMTLYFWPLRSLRNGDTGDRTSSPSNCNGVPSKESSGLMSPYPAGLILPDVATRRSCQDVWPPVLADKNAAAVGKWSTITRNDGRLQWAYDNYPLYTSSLDARPGDVLGGTKRRIGGGDEPAVRVPASPRSNAPPAFEVRQVGSGRLLVVRSGGFSVYSWGGDKPNKSNCFGKCLDKWTPVLAGETAQANPEWTMVERSPGVLQWAFRGMPLYTYNDDPKARSLIGSDQSGWHNVYTQKRPPSPAEFTQQETHAGLVLATAQGKTIYIYSCGDDALDQLACDHPASPQEYRLAVCGGGDVDRCIKTWPYVQASAGAKSPSPVWSVMTIYPRTGRIAGEGLAGALRVWAYRGRPVYTYANEQAGDVKGDALGEYYGSRNGFKAFWLRDDFFNNAG